MLAVPSNKRASEVEQYGERAENSNMLEDGNDDEGWVAPPLQSHRQDAEEIASSHPPAEASAAVPARDDDDIPDIDELELVDAVPDEASRACCSKPSLHALPHTCVPGVCLKGRTLLFAVCSPSTLNALFLQSKHLYAQNGQLATCRLLYQDLVALGWTLITLLPPAPMT